MDEDVLQASLLTMHSNHFLLGKELLNSVCCLRSIQNDFAVLKFTTVSRDFSFERPLTILLFQVKWSIESDYLTFIHKGYPVRKFICLHHVVGSEKYCSSSLAFLKDDTPDRLGRCGVESSRGLIKKQNPGPVH